jgi:hypothetical protein
MTPKKLRVAFARLLLAAPVLPLIGCGGTDPTFIITYTVAPRSQPDGSVWPGPHATCDEICKRVGCSYSGEVCELKERHPDGSVVVNCSSWCDGRRPEGLASPGRMRGAVSELGALFALKAHLEAASVPAFERLARELEAHGAPAELVGAALRSAREEVGHARAMEVLARRHGAPIPEVVVEPFTSRSLEAMALENAEEGCIRESLGALMAGWQARSAGDEEIRRVMGPIAEDELRHAELSWEIDAWASSQLGAPARERLHEARVEALRTLRRDMDANHPSEELIARAGIPSREATRMLLNGLAEVAFPPGLA